MLLKLVKEGVTRGDFKDGSGFDNILTNADNR